MGKLNDLYRTVEAMIAKVVNENQYNWDARLPKALFAYHTAVHEITPFHLMFGRSPNLPVDAIMGTMPTEDGEEVSMPQLVQELHYSLKGMYHTVQENLSASHKRQKKRCDQNQSDDEIIIAWEAEYGCIHQQ